MLPTLSISSSARVLPSTRSFALTYYVVWYSRRAHVTSNCEVEAAASAKEIESSARSNASAEVLAMQEADVAESKEALRSARVAERQAEAQTKQAAKDVESAALALEAAKENVRVHKDTERKAEREASKRANAEKEAGKAAEAAAKEAGKAAEAAAKAAGRVAARQGLTVLSSAAKHLPVCEEGSTTLSLTQVRRCTFRSLACGTAARRPRCSLVCVVVLRRRCARSSCSFVRRVSSAFTTPARDGAAGSWAGALLARGSVQTACHHSWLSRPSLPALPLLLPSPFTALRLCSV